MTPSRPTPKVKVASLCEAWLLGAGGAHPTVRGQGRVRMRPVPVRGGASRAAQLVQRLRVLPALKRRASQVAQLVWA